MGRQYGSVPYVDVCLALDQAIGADETITLPGATDAMRVEKYSKKTIYVKSTKNITIWVKLGADKDNMCFLMTGTNVQTEDESREWSVNPAVASGTVCFPIFEHGVYMQIVIKNTDATAGTVSVWMSGE